LSAVSEVISVRFPSRSGIETGELARQAEGAVRVTMGDTVVLVTVCAQQTALADGISFPSRVNYVEKTYAAGRSSGAVSSNVKAGRRRKETLHVASDRPTDPAPVPGRRL